MILCRKLVAFILSDSDTIIVNTNVLLMRPDELIEMPATVRVWSEEDYDCDEGAGTTYYFDVFS